MSATFTVGLMQKGLDMIRREVDPRIEAQTLDLLLRIANQPGTSQVVLSEQVGITISAISRNVERLVKLGVVHRYEDPMDRRLKVTQLTKRGERLMQRIDQELSKYLDARKGRR